MERFKKPIKADKEKSAYEAISKKKNEYLNVKDNKLPDLQARLTTKQQDIKELEAKLEAAKKSETELSAGVAEYNTWLADNKSVLKEFDTANAEWINLSQKIAEQDRWNEVMKKEKELQDLEEGSLLATSKLQELDLELMKLTKTYLPKIEGLKIKVRPSLDKEKEEIGMYYFDMPVSQLNESKFEKMWAQIFVEKEMGFLFFENLSHLGSGAVGLLNELSKEEGVMIFGTLMDRKKKSLQINFNAKIE
jgi:predicted RNase H-like nuclease (RuvC/YqgF family)